MTPGVLIVIVTFNSEAVIGDLLATIPAAAGDTPVECVVVDNSSTDRTVEVVRRYPQHQLVHAGNRGYSAGINTGVAAAISTSWPILALNPDLTLAPGAITAMVAALNSAPDIGIVAPRIVDATGRLQWSLRRDPSVLRAIGLGFTGRPLFSEYVRGRGHYSRATTADWALGAALLTSRECHNDLGGWDESFFLYSEETDFCLRAGDRGWRTILTPDATAMHIGGGSGQSPRIYSMQSLNRVRLFARRHGRLHTAAFYVVTVIGEASRVVRGRPSSRRALRDLVLVKGRPAELNCGSSLIPR